MQQGVLSAHCTTGFRTLSAREFHQIPQLILNQLRWLDHIVKGKVRGKWKYLEHYCSNSTVSYPTFCLVSANGCSSGRTCVVSCCRWWAWPQWRCRER